MSQRNGVPLEKKLLIIKKVEEGVFKKKDIAKEFGVPASTLSTIIKNKDIILKNIESKNFCTKRKRLRTCTYEDIDEAMLKWFHGARDRNLAITGKLMKQKARELAEALGHTEFKTSAGWLHKFKQRHGIIQKTFCCGESADNANNIPDDNEWDIDFNVNIEIDGQTKDNPLSDEGDILNNFLCSDDEELASEVELINTKESPPTLEQVSSSMKVIQSYLEMKSDVPINVFETLKILEDFIEGEKFKETAETNI